ncbi:P-loop NTPase [Paraburkholderia tropica]|uniref:P-loop NTPase n=1 Tax=Paraburkholderia tropica TaxID=92647 RepID=UPI001619C04E|nr:SIR2 family protein [Paraburkholderia tropica]
MPQIQNEDLFRHALGEGMNFFLGAGFSVAAESCGKLLPVGDGLRSELLDHFKRSKPSSLTLPQLCQIISSTQREALGEFFSQRFTVEKFEPEYRNLERVNIRAIFTTNIDDLIPKIFADSQKYYVNDVVLRGPVISGGNAIDYIPLHGCVQHGDGKYDFSPLEIASSFDRDRDKWFGYVSRIQQTPTLYWGYRLEDAGVLQSLSKETAAGRGRAESWIVLRSKDAESIEYYGSLGFQTIIADTLELLKYLGQLPVKRAAGATRSLIGKHFGEFQIPPLAKVPVRSISEFYLGAEPTWYDVYSGKIHETEHFTAAKNAIASRKHVALTGGAVSGKTTLLRQLATRTTGFGQCLYIDEVTPEKAKLLTRDIDAEGQPVLLFIDNAADASEAIQILTKSNNIKVVAAERDYVFESVAHRFPKNQFFELDVSGLTPFDIQAVQDHVPNDVVRRQYEKAHDELAGDADPTFFEVITSTILKNSLADRFMQAVKELRTSNLPQHDLLLIACYCYACRVPISVDIGAAFCRIHGLSAEQTADNLRSMGSVLSPYEGALADTSQDYYVPRSREVSELVLRKIQPLELKRMLEIFHAEVSPTKIGRYDVFRRNAYDSQLISRAFSNWEEGLEFYEQATGRDSSHSLRQHGALYLARKHKYELAFVWIDQARGMTRRNNAAIRNSYAVILFSANAQKPLKQEVIDSLDESMKILQGCYAEDHRKVYHAKVFADQAIKYAKILPESSVALTYLESALTWLDAELKTRVGDRRMRQLWREVTAELKALR